MKASPSIHKTFRNTDYFDFNLYVCGGNKIETSVEDLTVILHEKLAGIIDKEYYQIDLSNFM